MHVVLTPCQVNKIEQVVTGAEAQASAVLVASAVVGTGAHSLVEAREAAPRIPLVIMAHATTAAKVHRTTAAPVEEDM